MFQKKQGGTKNIPQQYTFRYNLIKMFSIHNSQQNINLSWLQNTLQFLNYIQSFKYLIDYFSQKWCSTKQPIFMFLDPIFLMSSSPNIIIYLAIFYMNIYWIFNFIVFYFDMSFKWWVTNIRKLLFILTHQILFTSFVNILFNMNNCDFNPYYQICIKQQSTILTISYILSFVIYLVLILGQIYLNFQFLPAHNQNIRIRTASITQIGYILFVFVNQINIHFYNSTFGLIILNISFFILTLLYTLYNDNSDQWAQRMYNIYLWMFGSCLFQLNSLFFLNFQIQIVTCLFISCIFGFGGSRIKNISLLYQLRNINKWPTPQLMMKQATNLKYFIQHSSNHLISVDIYGYAQIHRQKCDNASCPTRAKLNQKQLRQISKQNNPYAQQIFRIRNIIKKIYSDGYKLTPINPKLMLYNSLFLFSKNQFQLSLRNLLLINYNQLSFLNYYVYWLLKLIIKERQQKMEKSQFLDLLSEMRMKSEQQKMIQLFQKASIINLEFWSSLNQDHPDFQKLNIVGEERVKIGKQVQKQYSVICNYALSQYLTNLYAMYLQNLDNEEQPLNIVTKHLSQKYNLQNKIKIQNWMNSNESIIIISMQEFSLGKILQINTGCALQLGFERSQLLGQDVKLLFIEAFKSQISQFLDKDSQDSSFYFAHKSSYLIKINRTIQLYNSMQNGLTGVFTIQFLASSYDCYFAVSPQNIIICTSASLVGMINFDFKNIDIDISFHQFFKIKMNNIPTVKQSSAEQVRSISSIILPILIQNDKYKDNLIYRVCKQQRKSITIIKLSRQKNISKLKSLIEVDQEVNNFQFQFQSIATPTQFKYIGQSIHEQPFISQFSRLKYDQMSIVQEKVNYSYGISTLHLRDNVIQLIDDKNKQQQLMYTTQQSDNVSSIVMLSRADEEQIFNKRSNYTQFLKKQYYGKGLIYFLIGGVLLIITLYIVSSSLVITKSLQIPEYINEIIYQNLKIGGIMKQINYFTILKLFSLQKIDVNISLILSNYQQNYKNLNNIYLFGSDSFPVSFNVLGVHIQSETMTYITNFLHYYQQFIIILMKQPNKTGIRTAFQTTDSYKLSYISNASQQVINKMIQRWKIRQNQIINQINKIKQITKFSIIIGILFIFIISIAGIVYIYYIDYQRINILDIFLCIPEHDVDYYSKKTQSFLLSLNSSQQAQDGLGMEHQNQQNKHNKSSFMAKKKSFRYISFSKKIHIKLLILPLVLSAYFIHNTIKNAQFTNFQANSILYVRMTSQLQYNFSKQINYRNQYKINNQSVDGMNLQTTLRGYLQIYMDAHYHSYGQMSDYHNAWWTIYIDNLCKDNNYYGININNNETCSLQIFKNNQNKGGLYLIFTDMAIMFQKWSSHKNINTNYLSNYQIITNSQKILSKILIKVHDKYVDNFRSSVFNIIILWLVIVIIIFLFWILPNTKNYLQKANNLRQILGILPVSFVKKVPLIAQYFNPFLTTYSQSI